MFAFLEKHSRYMMILFFLGYFIVGLSVYDDYGMFVDDPTQRQHSIVNYKYVMKKLFHRDVPALKDVPKIEDYEHMYGVALQLPLVLWEDIHDFQLSTREIYLTRHLYVFFWVFAGYIAFYLTLRVIFTGYNAIPVLGTSLLALYPRFFAMQFANIKDLLFAAMCMFSLYFMVKAMKYGKIVWHIIFACVVAVAVNTRMMAVIFPVAFCLYLVVKGFLGSNRYKILYKTCLKILLLAVTFIICWYIITPMAWEHPWQIFVKSFQNSAHYTTWNGTMVFMGELITCEEMPWYYLFVWLGISIPLLYLVLFVLGHGVALRGLLSCSNERCKYFFVLAILFWGSLGAVIFLHSRIYIGWHHMYYIFVPFCLMACWGLKYLLYDCSYRKTALALIVVWVCIQAGWIYKNHPLQAAYLNEIGAFYGAKFDRDESRLNSYYLLKWIIEHDTGEINVFCDPPHEQLILMDKVKERVCMTDLANSDYIVSSYRNVIGNDISFDGFVEVYTQVVDGYKVGSVFKRMTINK